MNPVTTFRALLLAVLLLGGLSGCKHKNRPGNLIGVWEGDMGQIKAELTLNEDQTWSFVGTPFTMPNVTLKASGTYELDATGTKIAYHPTQSDVVGLIGPDKREELKQGMLKPETDDVDFTAPDEFTESVASGHSAHFRRMR